MALAANENKPGVPEDCFSFSTLEGERRGIKVCREAKNQESTTQ